jgi:hypothetical protein
MTSALRKPRPRAVWVAASDHADGLGHIHNPGVAATLWRRRRDPGFAAWIEGVSPDKLPRLRAQMAVTEVEAAVQGSDAGEGRIVRYGLVLGPARCKVL